MAKKEEDKLIADYLARETVIKETPVQKEVSRSGKRKLFEAELLSEGSSHGSNQDEKESLTRSLDKIVERFLERFSEKENEQFTLMDLEFTAVKRRIYDVINVLEGKSVISIKSDDSSRSRLHSKVAEEKLLSLDVKSNNGRKNHENQTICKC